MLNLSQTTRFKRELKQMQRCNVDFSALKFVIETLLQEKPLPQKYRDHELTGNWRKFRECHIQPDWLLIYKIDAGTLMLYRTGTHSDLF